MMYVAIFFAALLAMEGVAWLTHRYLMHGPLWVLHRSHHRRRDGAFERNDWFGVIFAVPSMILIALGVEGRPALLAIGLGMTAYGFVYFLVHDTSLEEQRYLSSVRYETEAFDALVRAKQHMAMPAEQEGRVNGGVGIREPKKKNADDVFADAVVEVSGGVRVPHGSHHGLLTVDGPHPPSSLLAEHLASEPAALPLPQLAPRRDPARDARPYS